MTEITKYYIKEILKYLLPNIFSSNCKHFSYSNNFYRRRTRSNSWGMWFSRSPSFPSITSTICRWMLAFLIIFVNVIVHNYSNWWPQHILISRYLNKNAFIGIVTFNTFIFSIGISIIVWSVFFRFNNSLKFQLLDYTLCSHRKSNITII